MDNTVKAVIVGTIMISIALGLIDYGMFDGTVSPLTSAAALASVAAFISIVLLTDESSELHVKVTEGLVWAALIMDILHLISLALGIPVHKYATNVLYFFFGYLETKKIKIFAMKPFKIEPRSFTAKSLAIDPATIMFIGYYLTWGKNKLRSVIEKRKGTKK